MNPLTPDQIFSALGDGIPPLTEVPAGLSFTQIRLTGTTAWLAGHGPNRIKKPPEFDFVGKVGQELTKEEGYAAARLVGLNLLVTLRHALGTLDRVTQVIQVIGAINCVPGFTGQSFVLNGCSDLLQAIFGENGRPARMAFGAAELPFGMAIEASMVVEFQ